MNDEVKRKKRKRKKPVKTPPVLGIHVSETIATEDKPHG